LPVPYHFPYPYPVWITKSPGCFTGASLYY
jgi:hypothetical protein